MKARRSSRLHLAVCLFALSILSLYTSRAANSQVLGWNNLGMHCIDSDYSVFSILPPYNTIEAQLIVGGLLITNGSGYTVTYQAVADPPARSIPRLRARAIFTTLCCRCYGANLPVDAGLLGWDMPGLNNTPQGMLFEQTNTPFRRFPASPRRSTGGAPREFRFRLTTMPSRKIPIL